MWTSFIGFMASGKSSVTERLSLSTSRPKVCTDQLVEQCEGLSIAEIFTQKGQSEFRRLEHRVLADLDPERNLLVDTGGGIVETSEAVDLLRSNGVVIWLDGSWEMVRARLKNSSGDIRPLVKQLGWAGLEELYRRRRPLYAAAADFRLSSQGDLGTLGRTAMLRSLIRQRQLEKSRP